MKFLANNVKSLSNIYFKKCTDKNERLSRGVIINILIDLNTIGPACNENVLTKLYIKSSKYCNEQFQYSIDSYKNFIFV